MTNREELLVELRDIKQRVSVMIALLNDDIGDDEARKERMWRRIQQAIQANDEAVANMGGVAVPCAQHDFAPRPEPAHGCCDLEEPDA